MNAARPWPRRRTSASTSRAASLTTSPACSRVRCSPTAGVGTPSAASCASSRSTRGGSGGSCTRNSAGSLRASSSDATASLAAIIRNSISRCDSVCSDGSSVSTWPSREKPNSGSTRLDRQRAPRLARLGQRGGDRAARRPAASPTAPAPAPRPRRSGPRAGSRAARRSGSSSGGTRCGGPSRPRTRARRSRSAGPRPARASTRGWRAPRAASARPGRARRREFARRNASRSSADPGRTNADTSAMCTHTRTAPSSSSSAEIASSKSRAVGGSIVNVTSSRKSDALAGLGLGRRDPRLALDQRVEAPPQPALEHQRVEHVARDVGPPDPPLDPRAAALAGHDLDDVADAHVAARLVDVDRTGRARRAASRAPGCRARRRAAPNLTRRPPSPAPCPAPRPWPSSGRRTP